MASTVPALEPFVLMKGDRLPALVAELPTGVDPSTAAGWTFEMTAGTGTTPVISAAGAVHDAPTRLVRYDWGATDTATPGDYQGRFIGTFAGLQRSFPAAWPDTFIPVRILPR